MFVPGMVLGVTYTFASMPFEAAYAWKAVLLGILMYCCFTSKGTDTGIVFSAKGVPIESSSLLIVWLLGTTVSKLEVKNMNHHSI